jgi:phosphatidylglycerophosphate synthase
MDALADKVLNTISFILLTLNYFVMICPLILEMTILFINYQTYRFGGNVQSSIIGKIKTLILDIFVIFSFILLSLPMLNSSNILLSKIIYNTSYFINLFVTIIVIAEIFAIVDYSKKYKLIRKNPKNIHVKYQNRIRKNTKEFIHDIFNTNYYLKNKNESILKQLYK